MRTEADKKARLGRIGSSDIAALAGVESFRTPIEVYRSCVEGWEPEPSEMMEIGELLEPVVLELYRRRSGLSLTRPGQILHPVLSFAVDTPDAVAFDSATGRVVAVEAKSCIGWHADEWGEPGTDQVPPKYLIQAQWHMLHLRESQESWANIETCDVPVLIGGHDFRIYSVQWDPDLADSLVKIAADFAKRHIVPQVPPPVDATPAYSVFLRDTYRVDRAPIADASDRARTLAASLKVARDSVKRAEEIKRGLENQLKAEIAESAGVQGPGFRITWKANKNGVRSMRVTFDDEQAEEAA